MKLHRSKTSTRRRKTKEDVFSQRNPKEVSLRGNEQSGMLSLSRPLSFSTSSLPSSLLPSPPYRGRPTADAEIKTPAAEKPAASKAPASFEWVRIWLSMLSLLSGPCPSNFCLPGSLAFTSLKTLVNPQRFPICEPIGCVSSGLLFAI